MSFRLRLTLLYTGLMTTAFLIVGALLYMVLRWTFVEAVDATLERVGYQVANHYRLYGRMPSLESLDDSSTFILIRDRNGEIARSANFTGMFPLPEQARQGLSVWTTETDAKQETYRLYSLPVIIGKLPLVWVQVANNMSLLETVERQMKLPMALGTLGVMALSAIAVWWVAQKAMVPIQSVAQAAESVAESADLSYRVPYSGPEDEVGRLVRTFNDMLDQLEGLYTRLAASMDAQQRFVADASHELRTPLTIIRGNIDYLQRAKTLDEEALADISSEAERMSRMVGELLTMARADAGQNFELEPVSLGPLVAEACRKGQALPHEVEFRTELPEALDRIQVMANDEWLVRLLLILIDNAFKYTPTGSVTVRAGRQGEGVVVQVQDTGPGIAKEDLGLVFDRFYRADRSRTRGGAGLGLAIARWASDVHDGRLSVESELGHGSTFSLWLPVHRTD